MMLCFSISSKMLGQNGVNEIAQVSKRHIYQDLDLDPFEWEMYY